MKCPGCGFESKEGSTFCEGCGSSLNASNAPNDGAQANPYGAQAAANNGYGQQNGGYGQPNTGYGQQSGAQQHNPAQAAAYAETAKSSMIFGILGLVFCSGILGLIFSIIAINKSKSCLEPLMKMNAPYGQAKAGKICGILGLVFFIVITVVSFILGFVFSSFILGWLGMEGMEGLLTLPL